MHTRYREYNILKYRNISVVLNNRSKKIIFENYAPFTPFIDCISEMNKTQMDNAKYTDLVIPMCNLVSYSDIYLKTCRTLWQCCRG